MPKSSKKQKSQTPSQPNAPTIPKNLSKKYIVAAISFIVIALAIYFLFVYEGGPKELKVSQEEGELKDISELALKDKPYITLTPTSEGAEIIVSIENMSFFDAIEYELTYLANDPTKSGEKIQRGSTSSGINTKDAKYKTSILLGTASKGVRSPDRGVEDGKLTLHLFKDGNEYLSETEWNLFEIGTQKTTLLDRGGKIKLDVPSTLGKTYWVVLSETVGIPLNFDRQPETVITPIFGTFSIAPKFTKPLSLSLKLDGADENSTIHLYSTSDGKWERVDNPKFDTATKTLSTNVTNFATFVVTSGE